MEISIEGKTTEILRDEGVFKEFMEELRETEDVTRLVTMVGKHPNLNKKYSTRIKTNTSRGKHISTFIIYPKENLPWVELKKPDRERAKKINSRELARLLGMPRTKVYKLKTAIRDNYYEVLSNKSLNNEEKGKELGISERTVRNYLFVLKTAGYL